MTRKIAQFLPVLLVVTLLATFATGFVTAQIMLTPTPPPTVVADSADWYRAGEPISYGDSHYYRAGAIQHFDGNRFVRLGAHRGVPLYTDKFLEPYGKIFVPLSGGLLQPYERRRDEALAGSTGNQAPSFPVTSTAEAARAAQPAPLATPTEPAPPEHVSVAPDQPIVSVSEARRDPAQEGLAAFGTTGLASGRSAVTSLQQPTGLNAIFVIYQGRRWRPAGPAVEFSEGRFRAVEDYQGFPVFVARDDAGGTMIYLPSRAGMITPYKPISAASPRPVPDRPQPRRK
jgi:hypothetical protein